MEVIVSQDYNTVTALNNLVDDVGYTEGGVDDRTTEVCLKDVNMTSGGTKVGIDMLKELGVGGSKSKTLAGLLSNWLMKYMGIKLSTRHVSKRLITRESLGLALPETLSWHPCVFENGDTVFDGFMGRKVSAERRSGGQTGGANKGGGAGAGSNLLEGLPAPARQFEYDGADKGGGAGAGAGAAYDGYSAVHLR